MFDTQHFKAEYRNLHGEDDYSLLQFRPPVGHVHVHRLHPVDDLVGEAVVQPQPPQLGHHLGAQPQRVATHQLRVRLAVLHGGRGQWNLVYSPSCVNDSGRARLKC